MPKVKSDHLEIEYCPPHELRPRSNNAMVHSKQQIRKLAKSMKRFGCVNPVIISDDNEIIAGHARVEAARQTGLEQIPTLTLSSLTPAERLAYSLADNRLAKFARYDRNLVAVQLEELTNLGFDQIDVTGFSIADIAIGESMKKKKSVADAGDDLPGPQKMVVSRPSDLWVLGPHRLYCEDAAAAANCLALMSGEQADVVLMDGPCSRLRQRGHSNCAMTYGQGLDDFALLSSFLRLATEASKACATMLVSTDCRRLFALLSAAQAQCRIASLHERRFKPGSAVSNSS